MNTNTITLNKSLEFFKACKEDEITFENSHCGTYTDLYSKIIDVEMTSLRVKVNSAYPKPDCVDDNNCTHVFIESIRSIVSKNLVIEEHEIDGKIIALEAFIDRNRTIFTPTEQKKLEDLLERFRTFYSKILLENTLNDKDTKIDRARFSQLFHNL
ncbi:MAG: hypothetical protein K2P31_02620 [Rickettsiaceae bacterium]|jgi:hypothetical protein|uniref:hypothetical protein n=1 Tax=Flavobacterium sp. 102 TaxID=2135623 RepID=UPI000EB38A18|nr:hypothetical protein [Flavobacterium sp. 102]MBY0533842.1 hypothetical protein [Rickettsiaceae bacterium]RKS03360.1 hypothetical protein C8C84_3118 [Flavobacterium sp. 102]